MEIVYVSIALLLIIVIAFLIHLNEEYRKSGVYWTLYVKEPNKGWVRKLTHRNKNLVVKKAIASMKSNTTVKVVEHYGIKNVTKPNL